MRKEQYRKLKTLLHGRDKYGKELELFEFENGLKVKAIKPVRIITIRLNQWKRLGFIPRSMRTEASYSYEKDNYKRCSKVKKLMISASPSTSFNRVTIFNFTNIGFRTVGLRVYKLNRKGE
jgi:hypothetical protein